MPVPTEAVIWAYRLLLGREAESEEVIRLHSQAENVNRLRRALLASTEFSESLPASSLMPVKANIEYRADVETLQRLREQTAMQWMHLGLQKPHFSVLTDEKFLPDAFKDSEEEFWQSGYHEVQIIQTLLQHASSSLGPDKVVVELGCGVGRASIPVSENCGRLIAYDISKPHLEHAVVRAAKCGRTNIDFHHHDPRDAMRFEPCDIVFSFIVLQHNTPPVIYATLAALFAALRVGGVAVVQIPTYCRGYSFSIAEYLSGIANQTDMETHALPQPVIFELAKQHGIETRLVMEDGFLGAQHLWVSNTFVLAKTSKKTPRKPDGRVRPAAILLELLRKNWR